MTVRWAEKPPWFCLNEKQQYQIYTSAYKYGQIENAYLFKLDKWTVIEERPYGNDGDRQWKELTWFERNSEEYYRIQNEFDGKVRYRTLDRRYQVYDY